MGQISLREDDEERFLESIQPFKDLVTELDDALKNDGAIKKSSEQISVELLPIWEKIEKLESLFPYFKEVEKLKRHNEKLLIQNRELQKENQKLKLHPHLGTSNKIGKENQKLRDQVRELIAWNKDCQDKIERLSRKLR